MVPQLPPGVTQVSLGVTKKPKTKKLKKKKKVILDLGVTSNGVPGLLLARFWNFMWCWGWNHGQPLKASTFYYFLNLITARQTIMKLFIIGFQTLQWSHAHPFTNLPISPASLSVRQAVFFSLRFLSDLGIANHHCSTVPFCILTASIRADTVIPVLSLHTQPLQIENITKLGGQSQHVRMLLLVECSVVTPGSAGVREAEINPRPSACKACAPAH